MEEYSEMNGQNDEQNTGGEFGGSTAHSPCSDAYIAAQ